MNDKERFHALMRFEPCDRILFWEQGFWGGTVDRWYREGMPRRHGLEGDPAYGDTVRGPATPIAPGDRVCHDVRKAAGLDKPSLRVPVELYLCPPFAEEVYAETEDQAVLRDALGIVKQMPKSRDSIPHFLSWPIETMEDFERLAAERLNADTLGRFPSDWKAQVEKLNAYDGVVAVGGHPCGLFGAPRYLMGEVQLLIGFLEKPDLVRAIVEHLADLWAALYDRILSQVKVDCLHIWEDMSFKNGPLISPALFREFLLPAYRKVTDVARSHGVDTVLVDTDGDCRQLIPLFLEGGVTGIYPFEVQAGMDVVEIREAFPGLQILGGIDKKELAAAPERIYAELERRIPAMIEKGGYIPMGDHQIPPDVSWENYLLYRRRVAELAARK
jgi:uroporphyrinogen decarboxylase